MKSLAPLFLLLCVGSVVADEVQIVKEGSDWVPLEYIRDIEPGSALDFSAMGIVDAPAGKHGWLVSRNGHAEFEGRPGVPARFYGVNLCMTANYLRPDEIEKVTDRLIRLGYNAIRIHHHDDEWAKALSGRGRPDSSGGLHEDTSPPSAPPDNAIDRLDRLVAACVRKGIYITTDLYVSRRIPWREFGVDRDGWADSPKLLMMFTDKGFDNWKRFARDFLTHVNPYTGRSLADEPAMPLVVLINESSPHSSWDNAKKIPEFRALWPQWLAEVRTENPSAYPTASPETFPETGGWWDPLPENSAKAAFWAWCVERFSKRATPFLRDDLHVKAMLTSENNGPVLPAILKMRSSAGDYVDFHFYVADSNYASKAAREETGLELRLMFQNHNALKERARRYAGAAFSRVWGRPLVISESQTAGPNFNRAFSGLAIGTLAAVQDWTGLWTFALSHSREKLFDGVDAAPGRYDLSLDPLMQAADRLPPLLFLRGDQTTPAAAFANDFTAAAMRADAEGKPLSSRPSWIGPDLEWRARLGVSFEGVDIPENVMRIPAVDAGGRRFVASEDGTSPTAPSVGVSVDNVKGEIVVSDSRTCGGFVHDGESFDAGVLHAAVRGHQALVAAASLDGAPLQTSSRILVWHLTDVHGEGFSWGGDILKSSFWPHKGMLDWGTSRCMLHAGEAEVELTVRPKGAVTVHALDTAGRRRAEVPCRTEGGWLRFTASTRQPFGGCMYYEIVRR